MDYRYLPEMIMAVLAAIYDIALVSWVAWGVVSLYRESHSWHSLWLMLMLLGLVSFKFIRD